MVLDTGSEVSVTDFVFTGGILFPDIISLNFTMSVDPDMERPVGSGEAKTAVVMHPVCIQSVFSDWPIDDETYVGCGSMAAVPFISVSPGTRIFCIHILIVSDRNQNFGRKIVLLHILKCLFFVPRYLAPQRILGGAESPQSMAGEVGWVPS